MRHIIQIILELHGVAITDRGVGKTTALLEYVAIRYYRTGVRAAILVPSEQAMERTRNMWRAKYPSFPIAKQPLIGFNPMSILRQFQPEEVYIDEPWSLRLECERMLRELPIFGAVGTPNDNPRNRCARIVRVIDAEGTVDQFGIERGPWALINRLKS